MRSQSLHDVYSIYPKCFLDPWESPHGLLGTPAFNTLKCTPPDIPHVLDLGAWLALNQWRGLGERQLWAKRAGSAKALGQEQDWGFKNQKKRDIEQEVELGKAVASNYPKPTSVGRFSSRTERNYWI